MFLYYDTNSIHGTTQPRRWRRLGWLVNPTAEHTLSQQIARYAVYSKKLAAHPARNNNNAKTVSTKQRPALLFFFCLSAFSPSLLHQNSGMNIHQMRSLGGHCLAVTCCNTLAVPSSSRSCRCRCCSLRLGWVSVLYCRSTLLPTEAKVLALPSGGSSRINKR